MTKQHKTNNNNCWWISNSNREMTTMTLFHENPIPGSEQAQNSKQIVVYIPFVVSTSRSFTLLKLITWFVNRLPRWVPLVEQELLTLPVHLSSLPIFSGVRNTRSLVLCVCFVDRCLSFLSLLWPLCCLSFDLRILITPLVSSNSSYTCIFFIITSYLLQQVTCLGLAATLWEPNDAAEVLAVQGALNG